MTVIKMQFPPASGSYSMSDEPGWDPGRITAIADALAELLALLESRADADPDAVLALADEAALRADALAADSPEHRAWAAFLRARAHLVARGRAAALLQLARAEAERSPVSLAADAYAERGAWGRPWLRAMTRAIAYGPDACVRTVETGAREPVASALSPDGARVVTAGGDGALRVIDLATRRVVAALALPEGAVDAVALHPDGARVVTAGRDGRVVVRELATGAALRTFESSGARVAALAVHPGGERVIATGRDGAVRVLDLGVTVVEAPPRHAGPVAWVGFDKDGRKAFSLGRDGALRTWDTSTGDCVDVLETRLEGARGAAVRGNGEHVVVLDHDDSVVLWNLTTRSGLRVVETGGRCSTQLDPEGRFAAISVPGGEIEVWDVVKGGVAAIWDAPNAVAVAMLPGARVAIVLDDGVVEVAQLPSGNAELKLRLEPEVRAARRFATDGDRLFALRDDGALFAVDLETAEVARIDAPASGGVALSARPAAGFVVTAHGDRALRAWDARTGALLARWDDDADLTAVAVGPGERVALGDALGRVRVFG